MWNAVKKWVAPEDSLLDTLDDLALEDRRLFSVLSFFPPAFAMCNCIYFYFSVLRPLKCHQDFFWV